MDETDHHHTEIADLPPSEAGTPQGLATARDPTPNPVASHPEMCLGGLNHLLMRHAVPLLVARPVHPQHLATVGGEAFLVEESPLLCEMRPR